MIVVGVRRRIEELEKGCERSLTKTDPSSTPFKADWGCAKQGKLGWDALLSAGVDPGRWLTHVGPNLILWTLSA